jgi:hypothetical protein
LNVQIERGGGGGSRAAVAFDQKRRLLACGRDEIAIARRIVEGVRGLPVRRREFDGLRDGKIPFVDLEIVGTAQNFKLPGGEVERDDAGGCCGAPARKTARPPAARRN